MDFYTPIGMPPPETDGPTLSPLAVSPEQTHHQASFSLGGWGAPDGGRSDDQQAVWSALAPGAPTGAGSGDGGADLVTAAVLLGMAGDARGDHSIADGSAEGDGDAEGALDEPSAWPRSPAEEAPFGF